MEIKVFCDFPIFASYSYLISENDHCLLIDCGYFSKEMENEINKYKYFDGLLLTHKHFDHIAGITALKKRYKDLKIYSYDSGSNFFTDSKINCSYYMMYNNQVIINEKFINLSEGIHSIGEFTFETIYTPGHCDDCLTFIFNNQFMFVGDFIFANQIGRCDLPTSSSGMMTSSLKKIYPYLKKNNYKIYCGHDDEFDAKYVLENNNFLKNSI